ncbi:unnamed protein product [Schistocephalus solidus]|uniref:C2H2-type domain-containing protein n=1 Tax=Schistocephalus solidus TaxID=70667 RepID=A0A183SKW2_SCHSO|nr:unnamed protein product [Schistocephalus solidus]
MKGYVDRNELKNFFKAIKAIYGPCIKGNARLLSSDGTTLLTEKSQILKHWAEHFRSVLNCSSASSDAAIGRLPEVDTNNDLDLPPSLPETIRTVQQISSGKAPGSDAIPPKVYKHCVPRLMAELTTLFQHSPTIIGTTSIFSSPFTFTTATTTAFTFTTIPTLSQHSPTIIGTTSIYSSPFTFTTATTTTFTFTTTTTFTFTTTTTTTTTSDGDSLLNCPQCDRTFTSRIGLVGHFQIHRTETGKPVPGAPTHSKDSRLQCSHCPRAFTHHMGLFGHIRIHDSGIHHNDDNTDTPCTP